MNMWRRGSVNKKGRKSPVDTQGGEEFGQKQWREETVPEMPEGQERQNGPVAGTSGRAAGRPRLTLLLDEVDDPRAAEIGPL